MKENEKVVIGWIDGGSVTSGFAAYISQIMLHRSDIIDGVVVGSGPYLSANRNNMAKAFLETNADWLLSLDSDLLIDLDSFDSLVESLDVDKYQVVAGKYYLPLNNSVQLAAQKKDKKINEYGLWIEPNDPDLNNKIIDNLHSVGAGYMMVHRSVFETIIKNSSSPMPWFQDYWVDAPYDAWITDDVHFFSLANRYGFNVALCTSATSVHLKTAQINDSIYLNVNNFATWQKEQGYKDEKVKRWTVKGKRK